MAPSWKVDVGDRDVRRPVEVYAPVPTCREGTIWVTITPLHLVGGDVAHDEGEGLADAVDWRLANCPIGQLTSAALWAADGAADPGLHT